MPITDYPSINPKFTKIEVCGEAISMFYRSKLIAVLTPDLCNIYNPDGVRKESIRERLNQFFKSFNLPLTSGYVGWGNTLGVTYSLGDSGLFSGQETKFIYSNGHISFNIFKDEFNLTTVQRIQ